MKTDFEKIRKELIGLYERFLKNPKSEKTINDIIEYEGKFGGLVIYNDILKRKPVPNVIKSGLAGLSLLYQYDEHPPTHKLSNKKIITKAKNILKELKKYKVRTC